MSQDGRGTLSGNTISGNSASENGGGLWGGGTLIRNTISGNEAGSGGALWGCFILVDNIVTGNSASEDGGGLFLRYCEETLSSNWITENTAFGRGGGLYIDLSGGPTLVNNVIADNQANSAGSGLYIEYNAHPRLLHTTIARNRSGNGSGVHVGSTGLASTVAMTDTIVVSHTVGVYAEGGTTAILEGTLWGDGAWANGTDWDGEGTILTGTINQWGDPAFVDPDAGDYHIGAGSAALDQGVDAGVMRDIDNEPRFGIPDLGADEYWAPGALKRIYLPLVLRNR